jgi:phage gp36-like protein
MTNYCEREDVVRWYGGTEDNVRMHFDSQLWLTPLTSFTVVGLTFDVPTTVLLRIDEAIADASSELDTRILQAYLARPTEIPRHLRKAAAKLAAFDAVADDGVLTDRLKEGHKQVIEYFDRIAKKQLDLGIVAPRPANRGPIVKVVQIGGTLGNGNGRYRGCGC